jgi:flagellin
MLSVNTNTSAMIAARYLNSATAQMAKSTERLSSGSRINRAADDPAGLAISVSLRSQIGGMKVAVQNAQSASALTQVADGALASTTDVLQRMRDLAVQASSANSASVRANLNDEFTKLQSEVDRIANTTSFGGTKLLDGTYNGTFQVGANNTTADQVSLNLSSAAITALGAASTGDGSGIVGLNANDLNVGTGDLTAGLTTAAGATTAIDAIDKALTGVQTVRGRIGSVDNRIDRTTESLTNSITNLTAADARITDVDVAAETAALTKSQIQAQTAAAMLAQANSSQASVLRLLLGF